MNRNDRKIEALAKKRGWKSKDVPNKLHQITHQTPRKKRIKKNPKGITVLIRDNEAVLFWREH